MLDGGKEGVIIRAVDVYGEEVGVSAVGGVEHDGVFAGEGPDDVAVGLGDGEVGDDEGVDPLEAAFIKFDGGEVEGGG